ncbi:MAG: alpha/beta fold hydrolase [Gemmatimonadales bacterium]
MRIPVAGAELEVHVSGPSARPAVLLIHGFPLDRALWNAQVSALSQWRCIVPDLRGAGDSTAPSPPGDYSMEQYAADLMTVLDAFEIAATVVCGLSMGGYVALELLRRYPERILAAVLCDTKAEADSAEARRARDAMAALAQREGAAAVGEQILPRMLAPATFAERPGVIAAVRAMMARTPVSGIVGALRALRERPDQTRTLDTIRVPVLVVAGADDQITPPTPMRAMARAIPGARFSEVPAAGHLPPLEQPEAVNRLLAGFLKELEGG